MIITSTETGEVEEFLTRISPRGVAEWLVERDALRVEGKPDRPPDVDTDTLRTWLPWPGEENLPCFATQRKLGSGRPFSAVYSLSWHSPERRAWLGVHSFDDAEGGYEVAFSSTDKRRYPDIAKAYSAATPESTIWDEVEELVAAVCAATDWIGSPKVTTYLDAQWFVSEIALAEAEIAAGFLSMPEGRA